MSENNGVSLADLEAQITAASVAEPPKIEQPVEEPKTVAEITPDAQSGQVNNEAQAQISSDAGSIPPAQVETKSAETSPLEALMKEKGITDPNVIAKMYKDIQADYTRKAQELAELKRKESAVQQPNVNQPNIKDELNQKFVQELAQDPIGTMAKLVQAIAEDKVKPFEETRKQAILNEKIAELSTSPDTKMTFNLKPVQDEMKKVIEENPMYLDNLPNNISIVHDIALGRLSRKGFSINAQSVPIKGQEPVPVDGRNKPMPPTTIDPMKASSAELEAHIARLSQ